MVSLTWAGTALAAKPAPAGEKPSKSSLAQGVDQAIADCTKALEINPKDAMAYQYRAMSFSMKKEFDKAWEDVHKAESLNFKFDPKFLDDLRKASGRQN